MIIRIFMLVLVQSLSLFSGEVKLSIAEKGKFQKQDNGALKFIPSAKENATRKKNGGLSLAKQWHVMGVELQKKIQHRPDDVILTGGVGHFNIGMMRPYAGIPIFIGCDNERPRLVGMTDANGKFAIHLAPSMKKGQQLYLYFSGGIKTEMLHLNRPGAMEPVTVASLAEGISTERYRVFLPLIK